MKMKIKREKLVKKPEKTYTVQQIRKRPGVYYHLFDPDKLIITTNKNAYGKLVTLIEHDGDLILPFEGWDGGDYLELKGEKFTIEIST